MTLPYILLVMEGLVKYMPVRSYIDNLEEVNCPLLKERKKERNKERKKDANMKKTMLEVKKKK